jgi:Zn-dependent alcohol dehydrogenase
VTTSAAVHAGVVSAHAAVFTAPGELLSIRQLDVRAPVDTEVRVRLAATGVCHTDQMIFSGGVPFPPPIILGHEGAGVIDAVGADVSSLAVGDHVVLTWMTQCGACFFCERGQPELCATKPPADDSQVPRLSAGGKGVAQLSGVGSFASVVIVDAIAAVPIPDDVPLTSACLIGCGVLTGIGAALNTAKVTDRDVVAVIGCGGVGLNVIQGARMASAAEIIAVDRLSSKLDLATRFGATHIVHVTEGVDTVTAIRDLTQGRGADITFEVVGSPALTRQALEATRPGGRVCVVGAAPLSATVEIPMYVPLISQQKSIIGCRCGSVNLRRDIPMIIERYRSGDLLLDELVGEIVPLSKINDVMANLDQATVARTVISYEETQ